jgi:hypothetical protein
MNEEALNYSFELFKSDGYTGSFEQYQDLLATNEDALNLSHNLFTKDGYNGGLDAFSELIGCRRIKKKSQQGTRSGGGASGDSPVEETMVAASPSQDGVYRLLPKLKSL